MWEKLKTILKTTSDKAIVIEDGEPKYVILSVDEYLRINKLNNKNIEENESNSQNQLNAVSENQNDIYAQSVVQDFSIDLSDIDTDNDIIQDNTSSDINLDDLPI